MFVLHDSVGLEGARPGLYGAVRDFIEGYRTQPDVKDQLHAIWYVLQCIPDRLLSVSL